MKTNHSNSRHFSIKSRHFRYISEKCSMYIVRTLRHQNRKYVQSLGGQVKRNKCMDMSGTWTRTLVQIRFSVFCTIHSQNIKCHPIKQFTKTNTQKNHIPNVHKICHEPLIIPYPKEAADNKIRGCRGLSLIL